jgi:hypothetical protein
LPRSRSTSAPTSSQSASLSVAVTLRILRSIGPGTDFCPRSSCRATWRHSGSA